MFNLFLCPLQHLNPLNLNPLNLNPLQVSRSELPSSRLEQADVIIACYRTTWPFSTVEPVSLRPHVPRAIPFCTHGGPWGAYCSINMTWGAYCTHGGPWGAYCSINMTWGAYCTHGGPWGAYCINMTWGYAIDNSDHVLVQKPETFYPLLILFQLQPRTPAQRNQ